jgi:membrane protein
MKRWSNNLFVRSAKNFSRHNDSDLAAGLTYYAVLSIFPAALALVSLLAVLGNPDDTLKTVMDVLRPLMSADRLDSLEPTLETLTRAKGAGVTLIIGIVGALYSASGYVGGFSRAMNAVREVEETRPFWKLKPIMLLITMITVVLTVLSLAIITASGPIARSIGDKLGLEDSVLDIWEIAKWPALALLVVVVVAILFHATPNVKTGRMRVLSPGAFVALLIWAVASTGFAFYVANFSSYNKTYGSVAGAIVLLLWLYLTNTALLYGAELDAARDARIAAEPPKMEVAAARTLHTPGMFPHKPGTPVYGPRPQPVPEED